MIEVGAGQLEVADEIELAVVEQEDGIGAALRQVGRAAARLCAAAPLIGENDFRRGVVDVMSLYSRALGIVIPKWQP